MCGIAGFFEPGRLFDDRLLDQVDRDLFHRGPDAGGRCAEPGFALVHRRLSIVDLHETANQPMHDPEGDLTLIYNGEIYNFRDLRRDLEAQGAVFRTQCDTEVILVGYRHWGSAVVERLHGMFAFVLIDRRRGEAIVARDHLGIKPIYLRQLGRTVGVASEMRPLLRLGPATPDVSALGELLHFGWAAGSVSNLQGIERVEPGTLLRISLADGTLNRTRYFNVIDTLRMPTSSDMTMAEAVEGVDELLDRSVRDHLMSDVGFSVQLSGGVDSSYIAARATAHSHETVQSFGIDLAGLAENEREWRDRVVAEWPIDQHEIRMDGRMFADNLTRAVRHMEGPVPHGGCVLLMLLCDEIRKVTKIVLTGEGADELFGGYDRYGRWRKTARQEMLSRWLPTSLLPNRPPFIGLRRLAGKDAAVEASVYGDTGPLMQVFPGLRTESTARAKASGMFSDFRARLLAVDQTCYLDSLLVRQDKMSMAASVEARVPFVHLPVFEAVNRLALDLRIPGGETKPLLKRIAEKYIAPDVIRRRKVGLLLPYAEWCRDENGLGRFVDGLDGSNARIADFADRSELRRFVERFRKGDPSAARYMFRLLNVQAWLQSIDDEQSAFAA